MDFREILAKRRSVRKFSDEEVDDGILRSLIDDAICAPSSGNEQPWRFIVVKDGDLIRKISDDSKRSILARIEKNPSDYAKKYEKMLRNEKLNVFYGAPAAVFIVGDASLKNSTVNCALAASYFMMSAADRGLGTCWINFAAAVSSPDLLKTLGITENDVIVAPIAVGYPEAVPSMPKRERPDITVIP